MNEFVLTHLRTVEAESIYILRAVASRRRPAATRSSLGCSEAVFELPPRLSCPRARRGTA
jgi:hypothetical protein